MRKLILFLFLSSVISHLSLAEVRYVSHSGSSTPPYISWETAADSIMSAINISSFGDTIYVANGVYEERVVMIPGLSLIGAGTDSCIIDTRNFTSPQSVNVKSDCLLKNFKILVQNSAQSLGTGIVVNYPNSVVEYNEVFNGGSEGIWCYNTNSIIRHNKIMYCYWGTVIEFNQPVIDSNFYYVEIIAGRAITPTLNSNPTIRGNTIIVDNDDNSARGYRSVFNSGANIYNNLFYSLGSDQLIDSEQPENIVNNVVIGNYNIGIFKNPGGVVKNNVVTKGNTGIRVAGGNPSPQIQYNDVFDNLSDYINHNPDSTNLLVDPMVINDDPTQGGLDFHLQMYSPLIDAGDPDILDIDGSRSDIGLFGGPYGEKYTYRDLAPRAPVNLTALVDTNNILLTWNKNTEADFSHYNLYRDTTGNFQADSTTFVALIEDTFYIHIIPESIDNLYYKLTAVDSQGNQSEPSEELHIVLTGTLNNEESTINNYRLFQNYPNPFNPTTRIGYRLKESGYVKLYVYDIKGELIQTLVNQYQQGGYYEVEFNGENQGVSPPASNKTNHQLASGIYIYQIMVRGENSIPVFTDIKKMVYIK